MKSLKSVANLNYSVRTVTRRWILLLQPTPSARFQSGRLLCWTRSCLIRLRSCKSSAGWVALNSDVTNCSGLVDFVCSKPSTVLASTSGRKQTDRWSPSRPRFQGDWVCSAVYDLCTDNHLVALIPCHLQFCTLLIS